MDRAHQAQRQHRAGRIALAIPQHLRHRPSILDVGGSASEQVGIERRAEACAVCCLGGQKRGENFA